MPSIGLRWFSDVATVVVSRDTTQRSAWSERDLSGGVRTCEAGETEAGEGADAVHARRPRAAQSQLALVHLRLTAQPREAGQALTPAQKWSTTSKTFFKTGTEL